MDTFYMNKTFFFFFNNQMGLKEEPSFSGHCHQLLRYQGGSFHSNTKTDALPLYHSLQFSQILSMSDLMEPPM